MTKGGKMNQTRIFQKSLKVRYFSFLIILALFLSNSFTIQSSLAQPVQIDQRSSKSSEINPSLKTWTGSLSTDWHNVDNWNPSGIPTSLDDVTIPDATNDPTISSSDVTVNNLTIESGAVLDLTTRVLNVEGTLTNNGTLKQTKTVNQGVTSNFLRITNQAGTVVKYLGVDLTPTVTHLSVGNNPGLETTPLIAIPQSPHVVDADNPPLPDHLDYYEVPNAPTAWVSVVPMPTPRSRMASATNGCKLYSFGGRDDSSAITNNSEVYDPSSNSWSSLSPLPDAMTNISGTWIDGIIYIPGGYTSSSSYTNQLLAYTVSSNTWSTKATMPNSLSGGAVASVNGKLYYLGGNGSSGYTAATYEYNPSGNSWSTRASAPEIFAYASATVLNGWIYIAGGWIDNTNASTRFWRYDPIGNSWEVLASMSQGRQSPGLVAAGGYIYAFGGGVGWTAVSTTEKYDPASNTWTTLTASPLSVGRLGMATGWVKGKIWGAGGTSTSNEVGTNEYLDEGYADNCPGANTAPSIFGLPDLVVQLNGSKDNAIDLWAYASDNETPDSGLTFTINNTPNVNAGVSIDSNHYIDITPASGWTGQTDVTIKVADPEGLYSTDTFTVSIVSNSTSVNVAVSGNQFCSGLSTGVKRCYDITPATTLNATLRFYFIEAERNALSLGELKVFHQDGDWLQETGTTSYGGSGDELYVQTENVNDFSLFALDKIQGPSIVYIPLVQQGPASPPPAPTLNAIPSPNNTGFYTVSWNAVDKATSYTLDEDTSNTFPHPTQVYNGPSTTWNAQGKSTAKYCYRVRSTNAAGNSGWSTVQCVQVNTPSGPRPGYWSGQGVSFTVTIDRKYVQNFSVTLSISGCGTATITHVSPEPQISNNKFSFSGSFYASGTFTSETAANGTGGLSNYYLPGCGTINGTFTWSANWQHYSTILNAVAGVIDLEMM
jgi:N-acetylneuraminic acid mutarotase